MKKFIIVSFSICSLFFYSNVFANLEFNSNIQYPLGIDKPQRVIQGDFNNDGYLDFVSKEKILFGAIGGTFGSPVNTDINFDSAIVGDFNKDGNLDLASTEDYTNDAGNTILILIGNGDGTFSTPVSYTVSNTPNHIIQGDWNSDTFIDLAVTNGGSNNISILLNNGDGTFATAVAYSVGSSPSFITSGDFNKDNISDLAVANTSSNSVSILLGVINGTFATAVNYNVSYHPLKIFQGDFDNDNNIDLVTAGEETYGGIFLYGVGDGTFNTFVGDVNNSTPNVAVGSSPRSITSGDFNGDNIIDLAVANYSSSNISILIGVGDGTFATAVNYSVGANAVSIISGDFNGDTILDLAVAKYSASSNVSILIGVGNGTFAAAVNYSAGSNPQSIISGYFNNDTILDLAVANYSSSNISILIGVGNGTFAAAVNYTVGAYPISLISGDFNGDTILDLAVAKYSASSNVSILIGVGNGTFAAAVNYSAGSNLRSITSGDFNGDNIIDLAVANYSYNNISILIGVGNGTFGSANVYGENYYSQMNSIFSGDINEDGKIDLVTVSVTRNELVIYLGVGDGTFEESTDNYNINSISYFVTLVDVNDDNHLDILLTNTSLNNISILLGAGDGTFNGVSLYDFTENMIIGDFNNDGNSDLIYATGEDVVKVLLENGDGTFEVTSYSVGDNTHDLLLGDFDFDGIDDLATVNRKDNNISILFGNSTSGVGDGTFATSITFAVGYDPRSGQVGDYDLDGDDDLAVVNRGSDTISILRTADVILPVISLQGEQIIRILIGENYTDEGATAQDNIDGDITDQIVTVNNVDINNARTYTVTYNVSDRAGNNATEIVRTVIVRSRSSSGGGGGSSPLSNTSLVPTVTPPVVVLPVITPPVVTPPVVTLPTTPTITQTLKQGQTGDDVKNLQTYLNSLGYDTGTPDGMFGPKTKQAVINFQIANNLTPDGIVGPQTIAKMNMTAPTTSPTEESTITRTLKLGMQGEDVKQLQTYLNTNNYDCGLADGVFGPKTKQAVIAFQLANGLTGDGIVGPITIEKIK